MGRASEAFDALKLAMLDTEAACMNDARFIDDEIALHTLKPICASCPLFALCATYGAAERPKGGVWAGKRYRQYKTGREANL